MWGWSNIWSGIKKVGDWAWKHRNGIAAAAGIAACVIGSAGLCLGAAIAGAVLSGAAAGYAKYKKTHSIRKALWAGVKAGAKDFAVGAVASRLAGARYVARYFGKVGSTTRYYRSFAKAFRKAPVRGRAYRQIAAGGLSYGYGRWGW